MRKNIWSSLSEKKTNSNHILKLVFFFHFEELTSLKVLSLTEAKTKHFGTFNPIFTSNSSI